MTTGRAATSSRAYSGLEIPKPEVDGYIVSIEPNLERPDGEVPPVDVLHLRHGVLANATATPEERLGRRPG